MLKGPPRVIVSRKLETLICATYRRAVQRRVVGSGLNGFPSAYTFSVYLLITVSKTFLSSVPHFNAVTKNLGWVSGKLLT